MAETVIVNASSSNGDIEYSLWDETGNTIVRDWQTSNTFEDVPIGSYIIKCRDEAGCVAERNLEIVELRNLYITGASGNQKLYRYSIEGGDISTATLEQTADLSANWAQYDAGQSIYVSPNEDKVYISAHSSDAIYQYSMGTPGDISTLTYVRQFDTSTLGDSPQAIMLKPDGTRMYFVESTNVLAHDISMSIAWDLSTATVTTNYPAGTPYPDGIYINDAGDKLYVATGDQAGIEQYDLSTPWDWSSRTYITNIPVSWSQFGGPDDVWVNEDGTLIHQSSSGVMRTHELSTPWELSSATLINTTDLSAFTSSDYSHFISFFIR